MEPEDLTKLLNEANWKLVRHRKHEVWHCPCGKHQLTCASTGSDFRGPANALSELRNMHCPSLAQLEHEHRLEEPVLPCHFCGKTWAPDRRNKGFYVHQGITACSGHPGVQKWHAERMGLEQDTDVAIEG